MSITLGSNLSIKGNGKWRSCGSVYENDGIPASPALNVDSSGNLAWAPVTGTAGAALSYKVVFDPAGPTATVTGTTATVSGYQSGQTYSINVYAVNIAGRGKISNTVYYSTAYNNATGGTVTEIDNYNGSGQTWRVHTFTGSGSFEVLNNVQPFRVLVVGGGGGAQRSPGTGWNSGNGGGGEVNDVITNLSLGSNVVTVGGGGFGGSGGALTDNEPGGPGGQSGVAQVTSQGGGGGGAGGYAGPATVSDITGANVTYSGNKGAGGAYGTPATLFGEGSGHATGGGGSGGANYSPGGMGGVVIISYQTAPPANFNNAVGGDSVYSYDDGNGRIYRVHEFTSNGTFQVTQSNAAFDILVVGGGGGSDTAGHFGGTFLPNASGGGGEVIALNNQILTVSSYAVTVGSGGASASGDGSNSTFGALATARGGKASSVNGPPYTGGASGNNNAGYSTSTANETGRGGGSGGAATSTEYGAGTDSSITGLLRTFGSGEPDSGPGTPGIPGTTIEGTGIGKSGIVYVRYQVAGATTFNAATGGTETIVTDYNGTGTTWKIHTFTSAGTLEVTNSIAPFRVLAYGGGGGRRQSNGCDAQCCGSTGGAGSGYSFVSDTETLANGSFSISIGGGGSGGGGCGVGGTGGTSSITGTGFSQSLGGGTGGGNTCCCGCCNLRGCPVFGSGGPSNVSNISGTSISYGSSTNYGAGGINETNPGQPGVVIVAYRIG